MIGRSKNRFQMKEALLVLLLVLAASKAPGQASLGRSQRLADVAASPSNQASLAGANSSTGAQYVQVSLAPLAGGAYNQGEARMRSGAQYVGVSLAPRRTQAYGAFSAQTPRTP